VIVVSYYNEDKIGFRILGYFATRNEGIQLMKKHVSFSERELNKKIEGYGVYFTPNGFILLDIDLFNKLYKPNAPYNYGLPYRVSITIVLELSKISQIHIRNIKLKSLLEK
jgi:hypothetical protein